MPPQTPPLTYVRCLYRDSTILKLSARRPYHVSRRCQSNAPRPSIAPRQSIDVKQIRQNPKLFEQNCLDRNYKAQSAYPARIIGLFEEWQTQQHQTLDLRRRNNILRKQLAELASSEAEDVQSTSSVSELRSSLLEEARQLKSELAGTSEREADILLEIDKLASALPNLTSDETPRGNEPRVVSNINTHPDFSSSSEGRVWRSHVDIGSELGLLDFSSAATSSGWGWYYLLNEAALLEQALIQYSLSVAMSHGWSIVSPPSVVYGHIAAACGFQPRDQNDEQQIYHLAQSAADAARQKPELALAATAEIPLAAMCAGTTIEDGRMPLKRVAVSRCYRAEAGARGIDTKGLYRVHEFTKVEMFAWTSPDKGAAEIVFDEMVAIQTEILESLDLHCRILEMPTADLGASATRKKDIEAFFPSRRGRDDGWGEVTSASICSDYQTRRLATRVKIAGRLEFPWTVNGTALAVPRVLAALMEYGWDEKGKSIKIPVVLRPWMGGKENIVLR